MFGWAWTCVHVSTLCTHYRGFSVCFSDLNLLYKQSPNRTYTQSDSLQNHPPFCFSFLCMSLMYVRLYLALCNWNWPLDVDVLSGVCVVYTEVIQNVDSLLLLSMHTIFNMQVWPFQGCYWWLTEVFPTGCMWLALSISIHSQIHIARIRTVFSRAVTFIVWDTWHSWFI